MGYLILFSGSLNEGCFPTVCQPPALFTSDNSLHVQVSLVAHQDNRNTTTYISCTIGIGHCNNKFRYFLGQDRHKASLQPRAVLTVVPRTREWFSKKNFVAQPGIEQAMSDSLNKPFNYVALQFTSNGAVL